MLSPGLLIAGKYRVIRKLGEGAMGSVWLAQNETTEREFAIKVLLPQAAASPSALARFLREAKVCGALRHPSILEIYDAGRAPELGDAPYLVMERLDGAPLDLVIRQHGAFTMRVAIDIVAEISRGLFLAHSKGIIHRDLKPANVFLHRPGTGALEPKVLDFGISKIVDSAAPQVALTNTAALLGSPLYMSPEQMGGETEIDARSDIHALGALLWECLTGKAPFAATSYNLLVVEIIKGPRPRLRDVMPAASPELAAIVERAFAIDPKDRFASAAELADALEAHLRQLGGAVLNARTAAVDVLGSLDLSSKPPPSPHSSTTGPLSSSVAVAENNRTQLSAQSPVVGSGAPSIPRSSATSFAETELAAGMDRRRGAEAVSGVQQPPLRERGLIVRIALGGIAVLVIGAGAFALTKHDGADSVKPVRDEAANVSAPTPGPSAPTAPSSSAADVPAAPIVPVAPVASAAASATATPPAARAAPKKAAPRPSVPPVVKPPRIDQSGL